MADCGINGTAIDRTVQSLLVGSARSSSQTNGGGALQANKVAAIAAKSVLGHATQQVPSHQAVRPLAPPMQLTLPPAVAPSPPTQPAVSALHSSTTAAPILRQQQVPNPNPMRQETIQGRPASVQPEQQHQDPQQHSAMNMMMNQSFPGPMQHQHLQQQHQQMMMMQSMMMQQQQQLAQMVQQQQQQQQIQQQQQQQQQKQQQQSSQHEQKQRPMEPKTEESSPFTVPSFGDDLLDENQLRVEMQEYLKQLYEQQQRGHHQQQQQAGGEEEAGFLGGTDKSIEELAATWAQAQADYTHELWKNEDLSNLGPSSLDIDGGDLLQPYSFVNPIPPEQQQEQHKQAPSDEDWMEQGMRHFHQGHVAEAICDFEHELQLCNSNNAKAWRMLGRCHAENDQDHEAILCFEHAVDRDPYSLEALLDLGVSYVNELNHKKALEALMSWVMHNPKYAGRVELMTASPENDLYGSSSSSSNRRPQQQQDETDNNDDDPRTETASSAAFEEVQRLLLGALEIDPTSVDVLQALGVVYNVSGDYAAAVDMFQKALQVHPQQNDVESLSSSSSSSTLLYQLWNKLGATLANSHRSDEALPAYHRALQLKPKYARGWLNMAISHSNLHQYAEAARCYLQALSLNPAAVHCWSYLRIAITCDERFDLIPLVAEQNLQALREHYDFVHLP